MTRSFEPLRAPEALSKQISWAMIQTRINDQEVERLRADPDRLASEMEKRMALSVARARTRLSELLSEDPFLAPHIATSLAKMPPEGILAILVFPIKNEGGALTGVGFEYRGDPSQATAESIGRKLTVVVGNVAIGTLVVTMPVVTQEMLRELGELDAPEHMCFRLLEIFGPIEA